MTQHSTEKDPQVRATATIWGFATGMFGICIPLVAITESGLILPLLVALCAGGGTAAVWFSPNQRQREETQLVQSMKALEERMVTLETIYVSLPEADRNLSLPQPEATKLEKN